MLNSTEKTTPVVPLGDVISAKASAQSLTVQCQNGLCDIEALTPQIVRLRLTAGLALPPYFSYATILEPEATAVTVREDAESIVLSTAALQVRVQRSPFGLSFADAGGQPLGGAIEMVGFRESGGMFGQAIPDGVQFYGLGERASNLALRGGRYGLKTTDPAIYAPGDDPIYINIPFLLGWQAGRGFGMLLDSAASGEIDLGQAQSDRLSYTIGSEEIRIDFIAGPKLADVVQRYTALTGRMALPPRWALGYQQSRWSYESAEIVREIAAGFRSRQIPCEAIHLDIDYMDGFRCFTWDSSTFPDPAGLVEDLHAQDFKVVAMIDPGIKTDPDYHVCAEGLAGDMFCKLPDGALFHGPVWPGECYFPDFTSPRVREWWGGLYKGLVDLGIDGFWNDMNEPVIFDGRTFPDAVRHDYEGQGAAHSQVHSAYGLNMVRATVAGLNRLRPQQRNWVFTRSGYAGVQRYASSWTGDNRSHWPDLRITPAMLMNLGLSGLSFTGPDVGGFADDPTPELFARWISMGAFTPFFRTHTIKHSAQQEPWSFGSEVEAIAREYLGWRYRLLPYLYTVFWQCAQTGLPIMRPLLFEDQENPAYLAVDDQWLLGDHLLVSPVLSADTAQRHLHLPPGAWYDFWTDEKLSGSTVITRPAPLALVPAHVRAGAVLPLGPVRQFAHDAPDAPLQLHVYPGDGESWLYEDDGESLAHQGGDFRRTRFLMQSEGKKLVLSQEVEGAYRPGYSRVSVILHGGQVAAVRCDDAPIQTIENSFTLSPDGWKVLAITTS